MLISLVANREEEIIKKVNLFEFDFISSDSYHHLLNSVLNKDFKKDPYLISPNLFQIVKYHENRELYEEFKNASYIIPDGQPIIIASKLLGKSIKRRLTGSDFFRHFWAQIKLSKQSLYIVSPNADTAKQLSSEHDQLSYFVPEMFCLKDKKATSSVVNKIVDDVIKHRPDFVIIGLGFPKQEYLASQLNKELKAKGISSPLIMLLGASLEFYTGHKKRAPLWIQNMGMEWFHRFLTEPRRLFKRYFIDSFRFIPVLIKELRQPGL